MFPASKKPWLAFNMSPETIATLARDALENEVLKQTLDTLEREAINASIYAKETEDEIRRARLAEARAYRTLREKLTFLSKGTANFARGGSFA